MDECGTPSALTLLSAWAPRDERAHRAVPRNRGRKLTLIAALTAGCAAAMTRAGAADVREVLAPTLRPGQIVGLDNRSVHQGSAVRALVEAACGALLFLPPSSPDVASLAQAFSKRKALLRRAGARTREALEEARGAALAALTPAAARAWFAHCGDELATDPSTLSAPRSRLSPGACLGARPVG